MASAETATVLEGVDERGRYFSPYVTRADSGSPVSVPIPSLEDMRNLDDDELSFVAQRFGWVDNADARTSAEESRLLRFNVFPDDPAWQVAMDRLDSDAKQALLGTSRRMAQQHEVMFAINGDLTTYGMIVAESAEPCDTCAPKTASEGTYQELAAAGFPWHSCLGGDLCM